MLEVSELSPKVMQEIIDAHFEFDEKKLQLEHENGRVEGRSEGRDDVLKVVVGNLRDFYSVEEIVSLTGLDIEDVRRFY